jgi:hypothetical protein
MPPGSDGSGGNITGINSQSFIIFRLKNPERVLLPEAREFVFI